MNNDFEDFPRAKKIDQNQILPNLERFESKEKFGISYMLQPLGCEYREERKISTTSENFNIYGDNDSVLIKSLKSINDIPIFKLENQMRKSHFLGQDESLIDQMVEDNETVRRLGLTHREIADFLAYFEDISKYTGRKDTSFPPRAYEYDHRIYIHCQPPVCRCGAIESPFFDNESSYNTHTVVSVSDGQVFEYSGLSPKLIRKYGFYAGKKSPFRVDPQKVAQMMGVLPDSPTDPIANLIKNPDKPAVIQNHDEIDRFYNLVTYGLDIYHANYQIEPKNLDHLFYIINLFGEDNILAKDRLAKISNKIKTSNIVPASFSLKQDNNETRIILDIIPFRFPRLKKILMEKIKSIDLCQIKKSDQEFFVSDLMRSLFSGQNKHQDYHLEIFEKIHKDPQTSAIIFNQCVRYCISDFSESNKKYGVYPRDPERLSAVTQFLQQNFPAIKDEIRQYCSDKNIKIDPNISIKELLQTKDKLEYRHKEAANLYQIAKCCSGLKNISVDDIEYIFPIFEKILENPEYLPSKLEDQLCAKLKIDPRLIPYAIQIIGRKNPKTEHIIATFFNGSIIEKQKLEKILNQIPPNIENDAKETVKKLIENDFGNKYKSVSVASYISELTKIASDQPITSRQAMKTYLSLHIPEFKDFFLSDYISPELKEFGHPLPIDILLNNQLINSLPEETRHEYIGKTLVGTEKIIKINIADTIFSIIDNGYCKKVYSSKSDKYYLRIENKQTISPYLTNV